MIKKNKGFKIPKFVVKTTYRSLQLILSAFAVFLMVFLLLATLSFSGRLDIERIEVNSPFAIDKQSLEEDVLNVLSSRYLYSFSKSNKLIYPRAEIRANILRKIPRASSVVLDVDQSVLSISLTERDKEFIWCGDEECFFLDDEGLVFQRLSGEEVVVEDEEEIEEEVDSESNVEDEVEEGDVREQKDEEGNIDIVDEVERGNLIVLNDTFANRVPKIPYRFDIVDFDKLNNILMYLESISINVVSIDVVRRKDFDNQVIFNIDGGFSLYVNLERDVYTTTRDIYISLFNVFDYESNQDNLTELDYIDVRFDNGVYFSPQSIEGSVNNQ